MALGKEEQYRVLYHLCWPSTTIDEGTTQFNSIIRDRLEEPSNNSVDNIERLLKELECVEEELVKTKTCLKVAQAGDVKMNLDHRQNLNSEYNRLVRKLSCLLGIPKCGGGANGRIIA